MADRRRRRSRRWLGWSVPAIVLATALPLAQAASAGTIDGAATAQAAEVVLAFDAPKIDLVGSTAQLAVGPDAGEQTVPGRLDLSDPQSSASSAVATSTAVAVARTATGVEATATVDGLRLILAGTTVASATSVTAGATCPADASAMSAHAQVNGLRLGAAAPVDLSAGQGSSGSTAITDEQGQTLSVELSASVEVETATSGAEAFGLRLFVTIEGNAEAAASFALARCVRPAVGSEAPGPERPDDGLADSGTDTAVVAALLGVVLVAGGGSVLHLARNARSRRTDPQ